LLRHSGEAATTEFSRVASRVAVAISEGIVPFVRHLGKAAELDRAGSRVAVAVR
jgi:hypothetical protein